MTRDEMVERFMHRYVRPEDTAAARMALVAMLDTAEILGEVAGRQSEHSRVVAFIADRCARWLKH